MNSSADRNLEVRFYSAVDDYENGFPENFLDIFKSLPPKQILKYISLSELGGYCAFEGNEEIFTDEIYEMDKIYLMITIKGESITKEGVMTDYY